VLYLICFNNRAIGSRIAFVTALSSLRVHVSSRGKEAASSTSSVHQNNILNMYSRSIAFFKHKEAQNIYYGVRKHDGHSKLERISKGECL
jgi:hypothetical protein